MNSPRIALHRYALYLCVILLALSVSPCKAFAAHWESDGQSASAALETPAYFAPSARVSKYEHRHRKTLKHTHKHVRTAETRARKSVRSFVEDNSLTTATLAPAAISITTATDAAPAVQVTTPVAAAPQAAIGNASPTLRAAPTPVAAIDMTRDAPNAPAPVLHDAGRLDISQQIVRMLGALLLVLALILGAVKLLQRYNLVPTASRETQNATSQKTGKLGARGFDLSRALAAGLRKSALTPSNGQISARGGPAVETSPLPDTFQLLQSLNLPGSSASIHMVQAAEKTLVLSATQTGAVSVLAELSTSVMLVDRTVQQTSFVASESKTNDDTAVTAFADILRQKAGLPSLANRPDLSTLDKVDIRLSESRERLNARIQSGAELISAHAPERMRPNRRRTTRAGQSTGQNL
jgi:flagellar biogenesis protein FliO